MKIKYSEGGRQMGKTYLYEADLESDCTNAVILHGGEHRKLDVGRGSKGQLDHAYWLPNGRHFIVEFKLPGEGLSDKQILKFERLKNMGHEVHIVDGFEQFMAILLGGA